MVKLTAQTPDYLGIPAGVWPVLGGAKPSGEGVVIGGVDTGINPSRPGFANLKPAHNSRPTKFRGKCEVGHEFPLDGMQWEESLPCCDCCR